MRDRLYVSPRRLMLALLALIACSAPYTGYAAPPSASIALQPAQSDGLGVSTSGQVWLLDDAPPPPAAQFIDGPAYSHYGTFFSAPQFLDQSTAALQIDYDAVTPAGTAVRMDVRVGTEQRWSAWETDLRSGDVAHFPFAGTRTEYRITLLGSGGATPAVAAVRLAPALDSASSRGQNLASQQAAPTWKLRVTRMGMVGGRTANGHIIRPHDHYVSLPSWRSLTKRGGYEYQVRITYKGRSSVAPVWDVGPWNIHDNYWDAQRERFRDLRHGWPEDHAAYYEHYNGGRAEKGRVRFPTAVDIGDGVWWDDLGIRGDQAEVEVTFLWLGSDPQPAPAPAPPVEQPDAQPQPASDPNLVQVNEGSSDFHGRAEVAWYNSPRGCGDGGHAFWTLSTPDAGQSENTARWQPNLAAEKLYDVYVHVPICPNRYAATTSAYYSVHHRDGLQEVLVNQATQTGWVLLGRFPFAAGQGGYVELDDITNDSMQAVWFDAAKWQAVP